MSFLGWNQHSFWRRNTQPTAPATNLAEGPPRTGTGIDHLLPQNDSNGNATSRDKKSLDPLFGPNIGAVTSGPAWTATGDKKIVTDDLTPDVVNTWIEKSRDPTQPTTTLQALVNLKRPTIKLSPLHHDDDSHSEDTNDHGAPHGLEFEYDCDAPKCGIYVHVFLPKSHPDAPPAPPHHPYAKLLVFESVVEGGFSKHLRFDDGAVLELDHFEHNATQQQQPGETEGASKSAAGTPDEQHPQQQFLNPNPAHQQESSARGRRRFTALRFRRVQGANRGPALAVVDAEPQGAHPDGTAVTPDGKKEGSKADEDGVKVTIRLAALDEQGTELANINEQVTYLHIVRVGTKPVPADGAENPEDTRPYVVKVVKREATIGPHTFHLHEIYGLTSSSTSKEPPSDPPAETNVISDLDEDPQSECLLCLSSPREVVLLPCRHLVACKECALNMVEFGAGGNITQSEGTSGEGAAAAVSPSSPVITGPLDVPGGNAVDGVQTTTGAGGIVTGVTITANGAANARRKRKAKGWFCPVCRQPYSSLLRITTAPPADGKDQIPNPDMDGSPTLTLSPNPNNANGISGAPESPRTPGFLGSAFTRPSFLRSLTASGRGGTTGTGQQVEMTEGPGTPARPLDVESGGGIGRTGT